MTFIDQRLAEECLRLEVGYHRRLLKSLSIRATQAVYRAVYGVDAFIRDDQDFLVRLILQKRYGVAAVALLDDA